MESHGLPSQELTQPAEDIRQEIKGMTILASPHSKYQADVLANELGNKEYGGDRLGIKISRLIKEMGIGDVRTSHVI